VCLEQARAWIRNACPITVLTGAGISAESGIPTFRRTAGLWKQFRPKDLATPQAFVRDPKLIWEWYDWRRGLINRLSPTLETLP
jgi:NAD-dependent deacetylase